MHSPRVNVIDTGYKRACRSSEVNLSASLHCACSERGDMELAAAMSVDVGMPIRGVTLYDNGYAVFERERSVAGHGHVDLYFPSEHMQSVLESLQFSGEAGKKVGNIAYEAIRPSSSIDIQRENPLLGLLRSLTGVRMSLQGKEGIGRVEGRVLGVEKLALGDSKLEHVTLVLDGGVIRTLSVHDIANFQVLETQVQQDIKFSLDLLQNSSKHNLQKLSVFYSHVEKGEASLVARYGFKVNEWKSSYRMQLEEGSTRLSLQGLAIVENTLDEDWNDVNLTLVVGAPAIEKSSQGSVDHGEWELSIKTLDGSVVKIRANPKDPVLLVKAKVGKKKGMKASSFKLVFAGKPVEDGRVLSDYSIRNCSTLHMMKVEGKGGGGGVEEAGAQAQFVMAAQDNLSYYPIPMRVTAQRRQKAIVPLLSEQLQGQRVMLYDETVRKGNPMLAVLFENTTGRTLEGGTLQISSREVFLGQGTLPTLHPGDESPPIPYAVELGCEVVKQCDTSHLKPHLVTVMEGSVSIFHVCRERTLYKIRNKSEKEIDFLLNHLFLEDYDLVQNPDKEEEEPVDITDRFYQFRFVVPPNVEKKTFAVREEATDLKEHLIRDLSQETLDLWVEKKLLDKKTEDAIRASFKTKREIQAIVKGIREKEGEVREVMETQERLRENISALEHHEKEAAKYIRSLSTEEDRLKALQTAIKAHRQRKVQMEREMNAMIEKISFKKEFPRVESET